LGAGEPVNAVNIHHGNADERWHWQFAEHYEILYLLAKGGQGTIYAARDSRTGQRVALKIIENDGLESSEAHQRLMVEAGIGNRLHCEHVVTVYEAGRDSVTDLSYLTMELLEGTDLQRLVERDGPVEVTTAVEYLRQIAKGLDLAHTWRDSRDRLTPIVHRDLKPANLFISKGIDGTSRIKILDFGIAKLLDESVRSTPNMRGSPLYMAPEQILGAQVSPATDIWAIGLLAFFLLTGKAYWISGQKRRSILPALLREVASGGTVLPSRRMVELGIQKELPTEFDNWFLRCVHREPQKRFESARVAVAELAQALGTNPTSESPIELTLQLDHAPPTTLKLGILRTANLWWRHLWFWFCTLCGFLTIFFAVKPSIDCAFQGRSPHSGPKNMTRFVDAGNRTRTKVHVRTKAQRVRTQNESPLNWPGVTHQAPRTDVGMLPRMQSERMNLQYQKTAPESCSIDPKPNWFVFGVLSFNLDSRDDDTRSVHALSNSTGSKSYGS
jgi:serine/threonine protein kinase